MSEMLAGGGEMGALIRAKDWGATRLGPVTQWPGALLSTLGICLTARFPMAIYWGSEGVLLYNDAWRPILGEKHPVALGQPAHAVWPEIWSIIDPLFSSVRQTGEATWRSDELLPMRRFGYTEECYFDYTFNPIRGSGGKVDGILNIVLETTDRVLSDRRARLLSAVAAQAAPAKTANEACTLSMTTLEADPHDLPMALLYLLERDGKSARLAASAGAPEGAPWRPESVDLSTNPESGAWPLGLVAQSRVPQDFGDLAERFGSIVTIPWPEPITQAVILPIAATGQGGLAALLVCGISPRRSLDERYRGFLDLLAGHIATAIADARAYEEERRRAEALAEIDRAKTTFFSNVSHEFRTPLALMLGPLEEALALTDGSLPPTVADDLSMVHRNGQRLLKMVNSLLDFARIEAGRVQASFEPVDLAAYTAELAGVFRSAIERAGLRLEVHCPPVDEPIFVDSGMWEKVVLNLVSNAFKYTLQGEISVDLHRTGDNVELTVRDTGCGIPTEELPRLFDRFHRVAETRGRTHEGTGIGLALVQELVHLHGGAVSVKSVVGQGSAFMVSLPRGSAHLPPEQVRTGRLQSLAAATAASNLYAVEALRWLPEETEESAGLKMEDSPIMPPDEGRAFARTRGARVILADDNADMRRYVLRLLQPFWKVEAVSDGRAALDAARRETPDLVLTDVMMPRVDGFGLLREIRASETLRPVPVILLSARAGEEARVEGMDAGADDYIVKPFSGRELVARVGGHLELARVRKEAEEGLRQREAQFFALLNLAPIGILLVDADLRIKLANPAALPTFKDHDLVNRDLPDLMHTVWGAEVGEQVAGRFRHTLETGEPYYESEFAHRRFDRDASEYYSWEIHRIAMPDGTWGVVCHFTDISPHVRARQALSASEARFRRTADEAILAAEANAKFHTFFDQGIYFAGVMTLDGVVIEANRLCLEACGYAREEVIGKKFWDCGWWNRSPELVEMVRAGSQKAATGVKFEIESEYFLADGTRRQVELTISPVRDETGRVLFIAPTGIDITERKRLAAERERILENERSARAEAERVSRMKDEFLATLSHELRTPLNAILGWSQILRTQPLDEAELREGLAVIERNTRVQVQLIEDLLDMSRIISGKVRLDVQEVDLSVVVRAAVDSVRHSAEAKSLRLQVVLDPLTGHVRGDPDRLQQCFWNLLSNAIKFTPKGGRVQVALSRVNSHVEVCVEDSGQGIAPEFLPHVFERFRQADASTTRRYGGLGLGLAIVKHLVELHGGSIYAKSVGEGHGSTFCIELPLMVLQAPVDGDSRTHPARSLAEIGTPDFPSLDGIVVLAIDDEPDARNLLKRLLERCGARVILAGSSAEGLEALQKEQPHMIVSDIGMPGEDGYEFIRKVRLLPAEKGGRIPAAALTAFARAEDRTRALRAGYQTHMAKPVEAGELTAVVASLAGNLNPGVAG